MDKLTQLLNDFESLRKEIIREADNLKDEILKDEEVELNTIGVICQAHFYYIHGELQVDSISNVYSNDEKTRRLLEYVDEQLMTELVEDTDVFERKSQELEELYNLLSNYSLEGEVF